MITKNPTAEEFEQSNTLRHLVKRGKGVLFSGGKEKLNEIAISLGYDKKYPWAYEGLFTSTVRWARKYPDEAEAASSVECEHRRRGRTPAVYALDLYANWVIEDYTIAILLKMGFEVKRNGADADRRIKSNKVTNDADLLMRIPGGRWREVELTSSYTALIAKHSKFHLRDKKYPHLKETKALVIQFELPSGFFVMFAPFYDEDKFTVVHLDYFKPWKKPAYEIGLKSDRQKIPLGKVKECLTNNLKRLDELDAAKEQMINESDPDDINDKFDEASEEFRNEWTKETLHEQQEEYTADYEFA